MYPMNNPYTAYQPNFQQQLNPTMQQTMLPQQTVPMIDGRESINNLRMAPNSSILLMEKNRPIVWLCVSDGLGNITSTDYDIARHQEEPPVDLNGLEQRVKNIEAVLTNMGDGNNGKPNARAAKPRQSANHDGEPGAD